MDTLARIVDPAKYCDEALRLRHKVQKLHWMGLDNDAEQLLREIEMPGHSDGSTVCTPRTVNVLSCC